MPPRTLFLAALLSASLAAARPLLPALGDCERGPSAPDGVAYALLARGAGPFTAPWRVERDLAALGFPEAVARVEGDLLVICPGPLRVGAVQEVGLYGEVPRTARAQVGIWLGRDPVPAWPAWRDVLRAFPVSPGDSVAYEVAGPGRLGVTWSGAGRAQGVRVVEYDGRRPDVLQAALAAAPAGWTANEMERHLRRAYQDRGFRKARVSVASRADRWGRWMDLTLAEGPLGPFALVSLATRSREGLPQSWRLAWHPSGQGGPEIAALAGGERGLEGSWSLGPVRLEGHWLFLHGGADIVEDAGLELFGEGGGESVWWRLAAEGAVKRTLGDSATDASLAANLVFCERCGQEGGVLAPYAHLLAADPGLGWRGDLAVRGGEADGVGYLQARVQLARSWAWKDRRLRAWGQAAWQDDPPADRVWGLGGPRGLLALGPDEGSAERMAWVGAEGEFPLTDHLSWRAFAEAGLATDAYLADIGGEADLGAGLLWRCPCMGANLLWRGDVAWRTDGGPPRFSVWFGRRG